MYIRSLLESKWFKVILFAASVTCLDAQVTVTSSGKIDVSVVPFVGPNSDSARKVIIDDLNRTLLINANVASGSRYIISVTTSATGLMGRLYDGANSQDMINKNYPGAGDLRVAAHQFSDDAFQALTGLKGIATSRVAFISSQTGAKELYVMDLDGAGAYALTKDHRISAGPAWSKDGTTLAYTSYAKGYPDVYIVKLALPGGTNTRTRIAFFPGTNTGPSFSPDGSKLALMLSKDGVPQIYVMPVMGGTPTRITRGQGTQTSPCWSPDGSKIVYDSDERGSLQLYVIPSGGGDPERLVTGYSYSAEPDWSPDGTKIAFTSRIAGQLQVSVYDLATKQTTQLTTDGGENPSWTRNSRHLVYNNIEGGLYLMDSVSRQNIRLENSLTGCSEAAVSP
jgi:TolB protein